MLRAPTRTIAPPTRSRVDLDAGVCPPCGRNGSHRRPRGCHRFPIIQNVAGTHLGERKPTWPRP